MTIRFHSFPGCAVVRGIAARLVCILLFALSGASLHAQTNGFDPEAVARHITRTLERDRVPGAAVAIVHGGKVAFLRGFGNDGRGQPIDVRTGFVIGSMSKAFTAFAAMRQVEAGLVTLDTPIGPHVPELQDAVGPAWQEITLGHLLTHTSGLPARTQELPAQAPLARHAEALAQVELINGPGARHVYSSGNYLLAARMLETIGGTPFDRLLAEQVLEPLGLGKGDGTGTTPVQERQSRGHRYWFVWPRPVDLPPEPGRLATASLTASAADMARFLRFQLGEGTWNGRTLLSPAGLAAMHKGTAQGDGFTYGLGWRDADLAGSRSVQHGGVLPNYRGKMILLPDLGAGVVILTNASSVLPLPIQPTSHRLANEIAIHLAGGRLGVPNPGYRTWLIVFWTGLGLILLHQAVTLFRVACGRDRARHPLWNAIVDIVMVFAIVLVLPRAIGLSLRGIAAQTPDLALWLAVLSAMALCAACLRVFRAARSRNNPP